jgi:UDP-N-acetyl-D-mannosaminuronic acid dehydrogenase
MTAPQKIVIVGGCGHVGLPLGLVFAEKGMHVTLLDIDAVKVEKVNSGEVPFLERGADSLLRRFIGRSLIATLDGTCVREADVVVAVVGTPVDRHLNPMVNELCKNLDGVVPHMKDGALLVLRSTVYPGVSRRVYDQVNALGRKVHVAFCPERITEGNALDELRQLPQIVAAFEPAAQQLARDLFLRIAPEVIELSPAEAELAKLFTNSWRYLSFAISNQFYILAESYGLDFYRIREAVLHRYTRMSGFAKAGFAAGPCLLKDTLQLAAFSSNNFFLGHAAMLINEGLPNFLVENLKDLDLAHKTVAILGMAFKADSDDTRESLACKLLKLLELQAREVLCTDPYVPDPRYLPLNEAIERADIIILGAPHSQYRDIVIPNGKIVVDIWGYWSPQRLQVWRQREDGKPSEHYATASHAV